MLSEAKRKEVESQIGRLIKTLDNLSETKMLMVSYLQKMQELYVDHCGEMKSEIEQFWQQVTCKSFYSMGRCQAIEEFAGKLRKYYTATQKVSRLQLSDLGRIELNSQKEQERLRTRASFFLRQVERYTGDEIECNQKYTHYKELCAKLNQTLLKFKSYQDPIQFYNLNVTSQFSKKVDRQYFVCESKEGLLLSNIGRLDDKRRTLADSLKQIQDDYFYIIDRHMANIESISLAFTDVSKDDAYSTSNRSMNVISGVEDIFGQEIQRFDVKYGVKQLSEEEELFRDLKELFSRESVYISSDYKLFMDRCETFMDKKNSSVSQTLQLQKQTLKHISLQVKLSEEFSKQIPRVQKEVFLSYGMQNFYKRLAKYFGSSIVSLMELCAALVENPHKRMERISNLLKTSGEKLKKTVQEKEEELKKFKKRIQIILSEHEKVRRKLLKLEDMKAEEVAEFKANVQKTFANFKNVVQQFSKNQKELDETFNKEITKISKFVAVQQDHSHIKALLAKDKEKYNLAILKKLNIHGEVCSVVKSDPQYEILFSNSLSPNLLKDFKTLINKRSYQAIKNVLHKKEQQEKNTLGNSIQCCGLASSRRLVKKKSFCQCAGALVQSNGSEKDGMLQILSKGVTFESSSYNPFASKTEILIPYKDIISFTKKNRSLKEGLEIVTEMGAIQFVSNNSSELLEALDQQISQRVSSNQRESKDLRTESSVFRNSAPTQFKVFFETGTRQQTSPMRKLSQSISLHELLEAWKAKHILSDSFRPGKPEKPLGGRQDYHFEEEMSKYVLKEKRTGKISEQKDYLFLQYEWKVSFPEMPMLKSFQHGQSIRIEITESIVNMVVIERKREEESLFARKKFYSEIDKMNKKLSDFISEVCERDVNTIIEAERGLSEEQIFLELESVSKQTKNEPRLSRMVSTKSNQETPPS